MASAPAAELEPAPLPSPIPATVPQTGRCRRIVRTSGSAAQFWWS